MDLGGTEAMKYVARVQSYLFVTPVSRSVSYEKREATFPLLAIRIHRLHSTRLFLSSSCAMIALQTPNITMKPTGTNEPHQK